MFAPRARVPYTVFAALAFVILLATGCAGGNDADQPPREAPTVATDQAEADGDPIRQGGLTIEDAQQLVPFSITEPDDVPESLEFTGVSVVRRPDSTGVTPEKPNTAILVYKQTEGETPPSGIQLIQTVREMPAVGGPNATKATFAIGQTEVTKLVQQEQGSGRLAMYFWKRNDVAFQLVAVTGEHLPEQDLERMIASLVA